MSSLTTAEKIVLDKCDEFKCDFTWAKAAYYNCLNNELRIMLEDICVQTEACDAYDEEWFALVATKTISDKLDWDKLNSVLAQRLLVAYLPSFVNLFIDLAQAKTKEDEDKLIGV